MHLASYKKMECMVKFYEDYFTGNNGTIMVLDIGSCEIGVNIWCGDNGAGN